MMPIDEADVLFGIKLDTTQGTCTALTFEQVSSTLPVGRFDQPSRLRFAQYVASSGLMGVIRPWTLK
jgi:hypothetical protein